MGSFAPFNHSMSTLVYFFNNQIRHGKVLEFFVQVVRAVQLNYGFGRLSKGRKKIVLYRIKRIWVVYKSLYVGGGSISEHLQP